MNKCKVLSRINPNETYHRVKVLRSPVDDPVVSGLAMTPSDIERLARNGIPVSLPNADNFYHLDSGRDVPPELSVDADRNSLWELSQQAKHRILSARRRERANLT